MQAIQVGPAELDCHMSQPDSPGTGLSLVLRAIVNGAKWPVPDGMVHNEAEQTRLGRALDKDGSVDMAAVAVHDLVSNKLAQEGLLMQVLSWEIMERAPTGVSDFCFADE